MTDLTFAVVVFLVVGSIFLFFHLLMGHFIRPNIPEDDKLTIYECGEPTVGSAWIQFDLRYYVVALLFVVFDVEVAFFFPWAVVFGTTNQMAREGNDQKREVLANSLHNPRLLPLTANANEPNPVEVPSQETAKAWAWVAFSDIMVFFGVLMVGFAYLWRRGDINWVKVMPTESEALPEPPPRAAIPPAPAPRPEFAGAHH